MYTKIINVIILPSHLFYFSKKHLNIVKGLLSTEVYRNEVYYC